MITHGEYQFCKTVEPKFLDQVHRLRYQVYVEEFGFERPEDHPGGLEIDPWDPHSIHFVCLYHGEIIGTLRLVLDSVLGLPVTQAVAIDIQAPSSSAEISRLAVTREFRQREKADPIITLGLYQAMYHESKRRGITHWYMITDNHVKNLLEAFGFRFHAVGGHFDYHGLFRRPYVGVIGDIERHVAESNPGLLEMMMEGLESEFRPLVVGEGA